ncbi:MAG: hypothetical protein ACFN4N_04360, partial [Streptococcus sp.]
KGTRPLVEKSKSPATIIWRSLIHRSINVVDADVEDFNKIHEKGVKITSQMVPNDTAEDFMKLLK